MPLILLVESSDWMKGKIEPRPDATNRVDAIPWEVMEIGDSVLVHLHVPQLEILNAIFSAQHAFPDRKYRVLMHSDCYEIGRIRADRVTPEEHTDYESWKEANGIKEKRKEEPPKGPMLH